MGVPDEFPCFISVNNLLEEEAASGKESCRLHIYTHDKKLLLISSRYHLLTLTHPGLNVYQRLQSANVLSQVWHYVSFFTSRKVHIFTLRRGLGASVWVLPSEPDLGYSY